MSQQTVINACNATCAQGVRAFAAALAEKTSLRPVVREGDSSPDVDFGDEAAVQTLIIEWQQDRPAASAQAEEWELEEEQETHVSTDDGPSARVLQHYIRTLKAIAHDPEVAGMLLGRAKPGPRDSAPDARRGANRRKGGAP